MIRSSSAFHNRRISTVRPHLHTGHFSTARERFKAMLKHDEDQVIGGADAVRGNVSRDYNRTCQRRSKMTAEAPVLTAPRRSDWVPSIW